MSKWWGFVERVIVSYGASVLVGMILCPPSWGNWRLLITVTMFGIGVWAGYPREGK